MIFTVYEEGDHIRWELVDEERETTIDILENQMKDILDYDKDCIIDLHKISHISSSVIGALLLCYSRMKDAGHTVIIGGPNTGVEKMLRSAGVHDIVPIVQDVEAAAGLLKQ
jgi:anti-anti-sigma factor